MLSSESGVNLQDIKCEPHLDVVSQLLESLQDLGQGEDTNSMGELGLVVLDLGTDGGGQLGL